MKSNIEEPKRHFEKVDLYTICICLFFLIASLGVLSKNYLFSGSESNNNIRIGQITIMENHVRRKFDSGMIWYDAKKDEVLFENDWIYTGEDSSTTLNFDDGGKLTLEPNSLIVLTRNRGLMKLELQHGSFVADLKKGTAISLVKNGKKETIKVSDKKIKVSDEGQVANLGKSSISEDFEGLNISIEDSFITAKEPKNEATILINSTPVELLFGWNASEGFQSFRLEVSSKKNFEKALIFNTENDFTRANIPFTGKVYWRVSSRVKDGMVVSEVSSFKLRKNKAPLAKLPKDKEKIVSKISRDQEASVEFEWADNEDIWTQYEVEVSNNKAFAQETTIAHDNLLGKTNRIPITEKGRYYWRVRGKDETGNQISSWSQPRSFDFDIRFHKELSSVELNKKNIIYYLKRSDYKVISSEKDVDLTRKKEKAKASWTKSEFAQFYKVELAKDKDFGEILQEIETSNNQTQFSKTTLGKAFYRVTPQFGNGDTAPPAYGTLKTFLPPPTIITSKEKGNSFNLAWSASPAVDEYEVVYYDHSSKQDRQTLYFKKNEVKIKNSNGFLEWKVRAVDAKTKEPVSHFTKKQTLTTKTLASTPKQEVKPGYDFPKVISPPKKKTFLTFDNNPTFVLIRWKYANKHTKFELEVSTSSQMDFVILNKKISKKKIVIRKAFKPGKYYFRVRAINDGAKGKWSPTQVFRFIQNKE